MRSRSGLANARVSSNRLASWHKVALAVTGSDGKKESHTVERGIVTTSDRDFVALTIAAELKDLFHPGGLVDSLGRICPVIWSS